MNGEMFIILRGIASERIYVGAQVIPVEPITWPEMKARYENGLIQRMKVRLWDIQVDPYPPFGAANGNAEQGEIVSVKVPTGLMPGHLP